MQKFPLSSIIPVLFLMIAGAACQREILPEPLPEIHILLSPPTGQTTDHFTLETEPLTDIPEKITLYYRWDWDGDGLWDTRFSEADQVSHRYYKPGSYLIRVEMADGKKQVRSDSARLTVIQGYSAPHPAFTVNPSTGNYLTTFVFDASGTHDDEDSLDQLQFRWDYDGNGFGVAPFSKDPIGKYKYAKTGFYNPGLEVKDPSGRTATFSREIQVTAEDTLILADFSISGEPIRVNDTVVLDASLSRYLPDSTHPLRFSWLLPDRVEWTDPVADPVRTIIFKQRGNSTIRLKVLDQKTSLYNTCSKEVRVGDLDLPPVARIQAGSANGNILTQFYFDSWLSMDDHQSPSELEARWDFDGDGNWDNSYSTEKSVYHQYDQSGEYEVVLQVRDQENQTGTDRKKITVTSNTNPTGFFKDPRDAQYYGTVTIGTQTWMSRNLNYTVPQKEKEGLYQWICLNEQSKWCDQVGKLYRIGAVIENRADDEFVRICPTGWRIPTQEDWQKLIGAIGGEGNLHELRFGGLYDFSGLDLGYADYYFISSGPVITDTVYEFKETFQSMHYFSSTEPYDINNARTDVWMWNVLRNTGEAWVGYGPTRRYMPVRCVRE